MDEISDFPDLISQVSDFDQIPSTGHPCNFFHRTHSPYKVILFEELLISSFQKHIVFICTDVSGRSCDGVKRVRWSKIST